MKRNEIYKGDCLELMPKFVDDKSVDMIFCDLPYGTTKCKWDVIIPFDKLWSEYERVIKDNGVIILFGNEPFSSVLRTSNLRLYRYDWIWVKTKATGFQNSKIQPMRKYENLSVFYKHKPTYNPQGLIKKQDKKTNVRSGNIKNEHSFNTYKGKKPVAEFTNYPTNIVEFKNASGKGHLHPTMKPLSLIEYMTGKRVTAMSTCVIRQPLYFGQSDGRCALRAGRRRRSFASRARLRYRCR